ncbi:hypothetical protein cyc_02290 [Cyclospora cayetanensis]|uniref:Uncharacterized protein n=1 Tax=Cyclospora cayetanensis TaxID=88456 RepID=A0A1D3D5G9_9EIME|nr:hypothetical protein cyc_02290 [Cyclospora cayetanensis]
MLQLPLVFGAGLIAMYGNGGLAEALSNSSASHMGQTKGADELPGTEALMKSKLIAAIGAEAATDGKSRAPSGLRFLHIPYCCVVS